MTMIDFESLLDGVNETFDEIADLPEYRTVLGAYKCKVEFSGERKDDRVNLKASFTILEVLEVTDTQPADTIGKVGDKTTVSWDLNNKEYGLPGFKKDVMEPMRAVDETLSTPLQCIEYAGGGMDVTVLFTRRKGKQKNDAGQDVYFQSLGEMIVG